MEKPGRLIWEILGLLAIFFSSLADLQWADSQLDQPSPAYGLGSALVPGLQL